MKVLDVFSGIGGFTLGLERAGMNTVAFCEIDPFCRSILRKNFPKKLIFDDIRGLNEEMLKANGIHKIDVIAGGFPCQPYSCAGKRLGEEDHRHLWPEMLRLIEEIKPSWVICENVANIINMGLDNVLSDLEAASYRWRAFVIPACAIGAHHKRERVWIVANTNCKRLEAPRKKQQAERLARNDWWATEPSIPRVAYGLPDQLDRIKGLGNSVVPQIPEVLAVYILQHELAQALSLTK